MSIAGQSAKEPNRGGGYARRSGWWVSVFELFGSMRFAISLLTLICVASAIGTVVAQNDPWVNYVNQFGPFWAGFFQPLGLFRIYNAPWFIGIMAFLVASTSICVYRNAPKMIRDMRVFRENIRESSLQGFAHRWDGVFDEAPDVLPTTIAGWLEHKGFKVRQSVRANGVMVAAKVGGANRLGYIAAHLSIVVICVGGLLDSGVPLKVAMWATGKQAMSGEALNAGTIPEASRLSTANPSYRANLLLPEGETSRVAVLNTDNGVLVQDLPFELTLKQFRIEFYSTGMPRLFASDVQVFDRENNKRFDATIEVNKPLLYKGVAVYQSSFDDGGTRLKIKGVPLEGSRDYRFDMDGLVGGSGGLKGFGSDYKVEFTAFKSINVESLPVRQGGNNTGLELAGQDGLSHFQKNLASVTGPGVKENKNMKFTNIGPSLTYKLRDGSGQAREFQNYMLPVKLDGGTYFLAGVRDTPAESFRFLRIPADENGSLDGFMRLRAALQNNEVRQQAAVNFAHKTFGRLPENQELLVRVTESAKRALDRFAGAQGGGGGLPAIAQFIDKTVPLAEREKATDVIIRLLQGAMWELYQLSRSQAKLAPALVNDVHGLFIQDAQIALSDLSLYGAPVMLQMDSFDEVKASVFQVAKAPGQWIVYLGCLLLVIGVFSMFYIRERRVFFWVTPCDKGSNVRMGMSASRRTMDFEKEYQQLVDELNSRAMPKQAGYAGEAI